MVADAQTAIADMLEVFLANSATTIQEAMTGPVIETMKQAMKEALRTVSNNVEVTFKLLQKSVPELKEHVTKHVTKGVDDLKTQLAGHEDNFLALQEKLAAAVVVTESLKELAKEHFGKNQERIKTVSDSLSEVAKGLVWGLGFRGSGFTGFGLGFSAVLDLGFT